MLRIKNSQRVHATSKKWRDISRNIHLHLQNNYSHWLQHQGVDSSFLERALLPTLREAYGWGFVNERDLRIYAEGCAVLGWRFLADQRHAPLITEVSRAQSSEQRAKLVDQAIVLHETQREQAGE